MEEKKEPEKMPEQQAPVDYNRYMGTLNRIYRRNNNPKKKRLGDGIMSLKGQQENNAPAAAPADGKKDHSFLVAVAVVVAIILILWLIKKF